MYHYQNMGLVHDGMCFQSIAFGFTQPKVQTSGTPYNKHNWCHPSRSPLFSQALYQIPIPSCTKLVKFSKSFNVIFQHLGSIILASTLSTSTTNIFSPSSNLATMILVSTHLITSISCMSTNTPSIHVPIVKSTTLTTTYRVHVSFCTTICQFPPTTLSKTKRTFYITSCVFKSIIFKFKQICKPITPFYNQGSL